MLTVGTKVKEVASGLSALILSVLEPLSFGSPMLIHSRCQLARQASFDVFCDSGWGFWYGTSCVLR